MTADKALDPQSSPDLIESNLRSLSCLKDCLATLGDAAYSQKPDENTSSIGSHVRHIIEFYQEFLKAIEGKTTALSYDKRQRDMDIELSRETALNHIANITNTLNRFDKRVEDTSLTLSMIVIPEQPMFTMKTTLYRELFHVLDHCVHHMAMLKMVAQRNGVALDNDFGVANSTQNHACASTSQTKA